SSCARTDAGSMHRQAAAISPATWGVVARMVSSSAIQDDDAARALLRAAADEIHAATDGIPGVVGAVPFQLLLAGREHPVRERSHLATRNVVDVHLRAAGLCQPEAHS